MISASTANSESPQGHFGHQPVQLLGNEHKSEVLNFLSASAATHVRYGELDSRQRHVQSTQSR